MSRPTNAGSIPRLSRPSNCFIFRETKHASRTMRRRAFISRQKLGKAVNWFRLSGSNMLVEVAKPVTLVFCILSLYAVFSSAFLDLSIDLHQRLCESLLRLALAAVISMMSGLIFRDATSEPCAHTTKITATLPVQLFCWASSVMLVMFVLSCYLETHCVFYRDVRF